MAGVKRRLLGGSLGTTEVSSRPKPGCWSSAWMASPPMSQWPETRFKATPTVL